MRLRTSELKPLKLSTKVLSVLGLVCLLGMNVAWAKDMDTSESKGKSDKPVVPVIAPVETFEAIGDASKMAPVASTGVKASEKISLQKMSLSTLEGDKVQLFLEMSGNVEEPISFATENPARIILDFANVRNKMTKEDSKAQFDVGVLHKVTVVEAEERLRVIIDLSQIVSYKTSIDGSNFSLTLESPPAANSNSKGKLNNLPFNSSSSVSAPNYDIKSFNFHRGETGESLVTFDVSDKNAAIVLKEEGSHIILRFVNAKLPPNLEKRYNVVDFGTSVVNVNLLQKDEDVIADIQVSGLYDSIAYQADERFTLEVRAQNKEDKEKQIKDKFDYTGERLSLNFQNIEVRAVLQLIADFTGLNVVTSDAVTGSVTLRLRNVPWDQALAIILKTKGLDKRQVGNVLLIGPSDELAERERQELEANQQVEDLAPIRTEYIQINYATADKLQALINPGKDSSLLSAKGSISNDPRTNMLILQDTDKKIEEIRKLVKRLDVPIKQVLIESRVVVATDDFERALGLKLGSAVRGRSDPQFGFAGNSTASNTIFAGTKPENVAVTDRLNVNLADTLVSGSAKMGLTLGHLPAGSILDLELQALESENKAKIVSSPRLITSDNQQARIEQGVEIPYQESTSSGATSISFKKAVLSLQVTPQITPDDRIILQLEVNQDAQGDTVGGVPAIKTQRIKTNVLVQNGETVVLGGIYTRNKINTVREVPILGKIPYLGKLFQSEHKTDKRSELMIFVTPKIIRATGV